MTIKLRLIALVSIALLSLFAVGALGLIQLRKLDASVAHITSGGNRRSGTGDPQRFDPDRSAGLRNFICHSRAKRRQQPDRCTGGEDRLDE